mgnify:CR=1 FL=1
MLQPIKKLFNWKIQKKSIYQILGGNESVKLLVENFYKKMETDPLAHDCLKTHPLVENKVPDDVKEKLFMFLSGWFGGPNLFIENFGHPRMRQRHMHIQISEKEKMQWLYCMEFALNQHRPKIRNKDYHSIINSFMALAQRIQNSDS